MRMLLGQALPRSQVAIITTNSSRRFPPEALAGDSRDIRETRQRRPVAEGVVDRIAGDAREGERKRGRGGGLYVGREPGRLVISPGGVISWMQLPSSAPTPSSATR